MAAPHEDREVAPGVSDLTPEMQGVAMGRRSRLASQQFRCGNGIDAHPIQRIGEHRQRRTRTSIPNSITTDLELPSHASPGMDNLRASRNPPGRPGCTPHPRPSMLISPGGFTSL
jgi:hypothetical protein